MMRSALTLLGAALCSLLSFSSSVDPQADFNLQAAGGKWFLVGFATNGLWFVSRRSSMKMGRSQLTPNADGGLNIHYSSLNADGSCWTLDNVAAKTQQAGRFTYTSQRSGSLNEMTFVEVKYDEFALTHTVNTKGSEVTVVVKLYGRSEDLSSDLHDKFTRLSLENGVQPENIVLLPKNADCPPA